VRDHATVHPRVRIRWAVGTAVGIVLALAAVFPWLPPAARETADQMGSVLSATGAWIALPVGVLALWTLSARTTQVLADDPVERLADLVARQWNAEAVRRGLRGSAPMRIGWRVTERPVAVPPGEIVDLGPVRVTRIRVSGEVGDLAATWRELPFRRLVVIGRPGAGKTSAAVLLTCDLLAGRKPGDPVPVLLDLSGWRPSGERFEVWLGRTLAGRYGLRVIGRQAGRLVADNRIVAVLDGLDEMPAGEREEAVAALNALADLPLVVMSRAGEYEATVTRTGEPLTRALTVELDPLAVRQTARYLPGGQAGDAGRWEPVERHLIGDPGGALARALSNPLLAYLARTVYRSPGSDPAELIGLAGSGELERRLFDGYLPALYTSRGGMRTPYPADRVRHWLGFLAGNLDRQRLLDFAWWRIGRVSGRPVPAVRLLAAVLSLAPVGLLVAVEGRLTGGGVLFAAVLFVAGWFAGAGGKPEEPRQMRFRARDFRTAVLGGMGFTVPMAVVSILLPWLGWWLTGLLLAVAAVPAIWSIRPLWHRLVGWLSGLLRRAPAREAAGAAYGPAVAYLLGAGFAFAFGLWQTERTEPFGFSLVWALTVVVGLGVPLGLLFGLASAFIRPAPADELWDPDRTLRADRLAMWLPPVLMGAVTFVGALFAAALGLWRPAAGVLLPAAVTAGLVVAVGGWFVVIGFGATAWLTYTAARTGYAVRGLLPWRLMPFLADAARRGVLRRSGAVYQFRHERLQSYLAGVAERGTDS
jgi:hypothetical protein